MLCYNRSGKLSGQEFQHEDTCGHRGSDCLFHGRRGSGRPRPADHDRRRRELLWRRRPADRRARSWMSPASSPTRTRIHICSRPAPRSPGRSRRRRSSSTTASTTIHGWRSCSAPPAPPTAGPSWSPTSPGTRPGDNPHIWYDPATMLAFADALTGSLVAADPAHADRLPTAAGRIPGARSQPITSRSRRLQGTLRRHRSSPRPSRCSAICSRRSACRVRNQSFQLAVMNGTEPSAGRRRRLRERSQGTSGASCWSTTARPPTRSPQRMQPHRHGVGRAGGRRHRNRAAWQDLPGLDDGRTRRGRHARCRD